MPHQGEHMTNTFRNTPEPQELVRVHWPGKSTNACPDHLRQLVGLAAVLGFRLEWTPAPDAGECDNCRNERSR